MFESPQEQVPNSKAGIWIGVAIVVIIAVALFIYVSRRPGQSASGPAVSTASMGGAGSAVAGDPMKDLRVVSVTMDKDYTGTTAQWLVDVKNDSPTYTYSNIAYQTTYLGAGNNVLLVNHGKLNITVAPGEDQSAQFRDALYPDGTAIYKINITGASASR